VKLSEDDIEGALYCVTELIDRRRRANVPVPDWMVRIGRRFNQASLSASGHESDPVEQQLDTERLIGTIEAATILGMSERQTRRIASDLDGEIVGQRWAFRLSTVEQYAEEKRNGEPSRSVRTAPPQPVGQRLGRTGRTGPAAEGVA
jgi:hypothetical protein